MKSVTLVIDESGAKGYSDNQESEVGELGVMSGILVPNDQLEEIENDLKKITGTFLTEGKFHITDLEPQDQERLRKEVFSYLISRQTYWVYEAIYVEGFFQNSAFMKGLSKKAKEKRRSNVKVSSNERRDLLHSELFLGAFSKGVALAMDLLGDNFNIDVVTDRVDKKLLKLFDAEAQRFFSVGKHKETIITGFDTESKKVVEGSISTEIISGKEALGDFTGVTYTLSCADSSLTSAADVLVNSVCYHLKSKQKYSVGLDLNTQDAIKGHPLEKFVYGVI